MARVTNKAPVVDITTPGPIAAAAGSPVTVAGTVFDIDQETLSIDWGDGTTAEPVTYGGCLLVSGVCSFSATHTYPDASPHTITASADDGDGGVGSDTVLVSSNRAPTAFDLGLDIAEDGTIGEPAPGLLVPPTSDPDGDALTLVGLSDPAHGTTTFSPDGTWSYTPDADYSGPDSFTYTVADEDGLEATGTVTVRVGASNDPPTAANRSATTAEDTAVEVSPGGNDVDGDELTFAVVAQPDHGSVTVESGQLRYEPDADYHGPDSFTYAADDGPATSQPATVSITVTPVNDAPTAADTSASTEEETAVELDPVASDVDGDQLTATVVDQPAHGTASVTASGKLRYVPDDDYSGSDSFTYRVGDGTASSEKATVSVTVESVNDLPAVTALANVTAVYSDQIAAITVSASDTETPAAQLVYSATGLPAGLALAASGGSATISGKVTAAPGVFPVTVKACDAAGGCGTASFSITVAAETATVRLTQNNPRAVLTARGGAPAMTFTGRITDAADASYGDIGRVLATNVSLSLTPVGGGTLTNCPVSVTKRVAATATTPGFAEISCTVAAGLRADVYEVDLVAGGSFAGTDTSVVAVYDATARGANGAGTVTLPNGNRGEFAFSVTSDKKGAKGKVAFVERTPDGAIVHQVWGPSLQAMTVSGSSPVTASITGKAVVDGVGNHSLVLTLVDGSPDKVGLRIALPSGATVASLTFAPVAVGAGGVVSVR